MPPSVTAGRASAEQLTISEMPSASARARTPGTHENILNALSPSGGTFGLTPFPDGLTPFPDGLTPFPGGLTPFPDGLTPFPDAHSERQEGLIGFPDACFPWRRRVSAARRGARGA
jgi:hypothetical protein